MLYTVAEISELTALSKVSIYKKLKLKEIQPHVLVNRGITYVSDEGLKLIQESLNLKSNIENDLKEKEAAVEIDHEETKEDLNLKEDYINYLKSENERLWDELSEKNNQLNSKDKLLENMQVLVKQEQDKDIKLLEQHFKEVDLKLMDLKENMQQQKHKKFSLKNIFKR